MSDVDILNSAANAAGVPSTAENGVKVEVPTLKIVQNKAHLGPRKNSQNPRKTLSKAAGKIKFNNNFKLSKKVEESVEESSSQSKNQNSDSWLIDLPYGKEAEEAMFYAIAWDLVYSVTATKAYREKEAQLAQAKASFYQKWGIPYDPSENGKPPVLTSAQKDDYAEMVCPFSFSYYEYRLSFKQPNVKAVRSKTIRSLKPISDSKIKADLEQKVTKLKSEMTISASKPTN